MKPLVHLGYEVGTGDAVEIPVRHMAVTGQTQESGKTTTLEALISRSGLSAIAFLTKRGEGSFSTAVRVLPYFQERTDWQFVQSIIESVLRKDQQFKQPWIMRACEGAKSLADVQRRTKQLEADTKNSFSQDMYMVLGAYLDKVVPAIAALPKSSRVEIQRGRLAVMDLVSYPLELQFLVIASTLAWIHKHEQNVITIIPEAWKFIPQGRNTPVRIAAESLIREGAGLRNYVWIDSQDMAAVDKILLRACAVWLIGVQREANEVKRAIGNMPAGLKRPAPGNVSTLELGQFFACFGSVIKKTYVQPAWMEKEIARGIALGDVELRTAIDAMPKKLSQPIGRLVGIKHGELPFTESPSGSGSAGDDLAGDGCTDLAAVSQNLPTQPRNEGEGAGPGMATGKEQALPIIHDQEEAMPAAPDIETMFQKFVEESKAESSFHLPGHGWNANAMIAFGRKCMEAATGNRNGSSVMVSVSRSEADSGRVMAADNLVQLVIDQIRNNPAFLAEVSAVQPEIRVKVQKQVVELDGSTIEGKLALLIADGFFSAYTSGDKAFKELKRKGAEVASITVYRQLDKFCAMGFLTKLERQGYKEVSGMKVSRNTLEVQQ